MVLTAGHCILHASIVQIAYGEEAEAPETTVDPVECKASPFGDWVDVFGEAQYEGVDLAYCLLPGGAPSLPVVPVLTPDTCENDHLRDLLFSPGAPVFGEPTEMVGVGLEEYVPPGAPGESGTKRAASGASVLFELYIPQLQARRVVALQPGQQAGNDPNAKAVLGGDSGGGLSFEMPDGSWRTLGNLANVVKAQYDLDGTGQVMRQHAYYDSTPRSLTWVEQESGADITACHTWNGTKWVWDNNPFCGGLYDTSPETASSQWPGCSSTTLTSTGNCGGAVPPGPGGYTSDTQAARMEDFLLSGEAALAPEFFGALSLRQWLGTEGGDSLTSLSRASMEVFGGRGDDALFFGAGADEMHGGTGDDLLRGGDGDDVIVPGRGIDFALGGDGDDVIILNGTCEFGNGESIDGGAGFDILYSPIDLAGLAAAGVSVSGIEQVILNHPDAEVLTCQSPIKVEVAPI